MKWVAYFFLALLLLPFLFSILVSFTPSMYLELPSGGWTLKWYALVLNGIVWKQAIANSLITAVLTAAISVATALATALVLVGTRFRWAAAWEGALLLPMVLPTVSLAVGMLALLRTTPLWGSLVSLAVAHSILAVPVAYLVLRASLRQVDTNLEAAARGLGAGHWQVFRFVTLPLIMPAALAATLFSLVISLNEVTLTLFLATRYTETLPRVIWPNLRFAITPQVAAASVILLMLTLPALAAGGWWLLPRRGRQ